MIESDTSIEHLVDHAQAQKPIANDLGLARYATMLRVCIESPYTAQPGSTVAEHVEYLNRALRDSISKNEAPIASHGLFPSALNDNIMFQRLSGMNAGWAWLLHAEKLIVYSDYGISDGMAQGIALATSHGIPISYRQIGRNESPSS